MNIKVSLLYVLAVLFTLPVWAQNKFSEGTISYDIKINTGSDKPQAADLFDGATSTVYLKGPKSRTEIVSSLGTQATINDAANNLTVILKEYGEQKYLINLTPANWRDINKKYENVKFTFYNDTKKVAGYTTKKAIGTLNDGTSFTVWYAPDLVPQNKEFQYINSSLPGLAMEFESSIGSLKVTYTVSKISFSPVPAAKFDLPKAGYRVMTYEESKGSR